MSTKYTVIAIHPKRKGPTKQHIEVIKSDILDSAEADNVKNDYIARYPGMTAGNVQKLTYTDAP